MTCLPFPLFVPVIRNGFQRDNIVRARFSCFGKSVTKLKLLPCKYKKIIQFYPIVSDILLMGVDKCSNVSFVNDF